MSAKPIPDGYHTLTPSLTQRDTARAIEFYQKAFGAEEVVRMAGPDGQGIMHAEIRIGDSMFMMADENPAWGNRSAETLGGSPVGLMLYVNDVDASFERAVKAGATAKMPVADMFWGDRMGSVVDPFGYQWSIGTHKEDLSPEETRKRGKAWAEQLAQQKQK